MWWLLETNIFRAIQAAQTAGILPTAEQQAHFEANHSAQASDSTSRILSAAGNTAEISIKGVITQTPSFLAFLFGGGNVTYSEIISALAEADADPAITNIVFAIDSPGGHFAGLFDLLAAISSSNKPNKAIISGTGASAAFAIAAQTDEIVATNVASRIGSVGVAVTIGLDPNEVTITSTDAPKKRPDVTTEEGRDMVREELDAMHEIFVDAIAEGRGTTVEKVNAEFGQGATLLANEALKRGMIDSVASTSLRLVSNADSKTTAKINSGKTSEKGPMNLTELKATHPDVYAAAVNEGQATERDRVSAHLIMGVQSGAMETAIEACKEGTAMTATLQATYMTAGMNRNDVKDRQDDDASADAGDGATKEESGDESGTVADQVETLLGFNVEA